MPELPEVETSRRGIAPWIENQAVTKVVVRDRRLRWPVSEEVDRNLEGQTIDSIRRRAKYLLFETGTGTMMMHLGMSGSVRIIEVGEPPMKHDHVDIHLASGKALRFRDPRRFGSLIWAENPREHALIRDLGPEPLSDDFNGDYLRERASGRKVSIKQFIMNAHIVVGVGNIYASESLHMAGIHPNRPAGRISEARYERLAGCIRKVLAAAIEAGGTTLRDFTGSDGQPGYFAHHLNVYGHAGAPCPGCGAPIRQRVIGQRASYFCPACQR